MSRKNIWTIPYADDVLLLENNAAGSKQMLRKLRKYLREKGDETEKRPSHGMESRFRK